MTSRTKDVEQQRRLDEPTNAAPSPLLLTLVFIFAYAYGKWKWAVAALTTVILAMGLSAVLSKLNLPEDDDIRNSNKNKKDITMERILSHYKNMTIEDILQEIQELEQHVGERKSDHDAINDSIIMRTKVVAFLEALTRQCCRERDEQQRKQKTSKRQQKEQPATDTSSLILLDSTAANNKGPSHQEVEDDPPLQVCSYLAAHFALQIFPSTVSNMEVAQAALALYALVSQHEQVQQQILQHPHDLDVPIQVMQRALDHARNVLQDDNGNDEKEHQIADTIQKGCLLLGALADNHADMAMQIVDHHGLQVILDSASWFRHHELVVQWSLWAIFQLCYEHERNQRILVETGGLMIICTNLKTLPSHPQLVRHGLGTMLDTLRLLSPHMPNLVRLALAAGLQDAVLLVLKYHSNVLDIKMMADELLRGTGYQGPRPQPRA